MIKILLSYLADEEMKLIEIEKGLVPNIRLNVVTRRDDSTYGIIFPGTVIRT